jgi:peptidoglycan/LPS O-acetylase OafA/YrhL
MENHHHAAKSHYPWLDWLRFIAAMIVFLGHARGALFVEYGGLPPEQRQPIIALLFALTRLGNEAVIIFFVLSGFFVAGRGSVRMLEGKFSIMDYARDRFVRIYTPYLPALLLTGICSIALAQTESLVNLSIDFAGNLLGLQGIFVSSLGGNVSLWSLAYEIWFYILLGAVAGFSQWQHQRPVFTYLSVLILLLSAIVFTHLSPTYLMCWIIGGLAFWYRPSTWQIRHFIITIAMVIFGIVGVQIRSNSVSVTLPQWAMIFPSVAVNQLILATGIAALIPQLVLLVPQSEIAKKWERLGTILASFSYTLYLIHYPLVKIIQQWIFPKSNSLNLISITNFFANSRMKCNT